MASLGQRRPMVVAAGKHVSVFNEQNICFAKIDVKGYQAYIPQGDVDQFRGDGTLLLLELNAWCLWPTLASIPGVVEWIFGNFSHVAVLRPSEANILDDKRTVGRHRPGS
jgi:hypothetical protein